MQVTLTPLQQGGSDQMNVNDLMNSPECMFTMILQAEATGWAPYFASLLGLTESFSVAWIRGLMNTVIQVSYPARLHAHVPLQECHCAHGHNPNSLHAPAACILFWPVITLFDASPLGDFPGKLRCKLRCYVARLCNVRWHTRPRPLEGSLGIV